MSGVIEKRMYKGTNQVPLGPLGKPRLLYKVKKKTSLLLRIHPFISTPGFTGAVLSLNVLSLSILLKVCLTYPKTPSPLAPL